MFALVSPVPSTAFGRRKRLAISSFSNSVYSGQLQHFHAVPEGLRNVCSTLAVQMNITCDRSLDVEVVIQERVVLLRIDTRAGQPTGRREVHRHLVDFVQQEHRVHRAGLLHHLDDLAGEGADVGAAVAADLGLVTHAPSDSRTNFRFIARAIDLASDVLPTPGGPAK